MPTVFTPYKVHAKPVFVHVATFDRYNVALRRVWHDTEKVAVWSAYKVGPHGVTCLRCGSRKKMNEEAWHSEYHTTRTGRRERLCNECIRAIQEETP